MKCRTHPKDDTSYAGVCASCLRQRLLALVPAQPPQQHHFKQDNCLSKKKKSNKLWLFSSLFQSKSAVVQPKSWLPSILWRRKTMVMCSLNESSIRRHGKSNRIRGEVISPELCSDDEDECTHFKINTSGCAAEDLKHSGRRGHHMNHRNRGRGMSPAMCSDDEKEAKTNFYAREELKRTPMTTPARKGGGRRGHLSRNISQIVFCLSPLVSQSPNRIRTQKGGIPPQIGYSGDLRVLAKRENSKTTPFCKNRSRKLVDFGRNNPNR